MTKTILVVDDEERMKPQPVALVDDRGQVVKGGLGFQNNQQLTVDQYEKGEPIEIDGQVKTSLLASIYLPRARRPIFNSTGKR